MARRTPWEVASSLAHDSGPPLYYWLLSLWRLAAGETEAGLRSLSLLLALAATLLLHRLAWRHLGPGTARAAVLVWATSPLALFYAREARNYTLLAFLTLGFLLALLEAGDRRPWRILLALPWFLALVYTHNVGWFAGAAGLLAALLSPGERGRRVAPLGAVALGTVLLYLPWVPVFRAQMANSIRIVGWARDFWTPSAPLLSLRGFVPGTPSPRYLDIPALPAPWWGVALLAAAALAAGAAWSLAGERRPGMVFLLLFTAGGLLLPAAYSLAASPVYLVGRTDFFLLAAAAALAGLGMRRLGGAGVACLLILAVTGLAAGHRLRGWEPSPGERPWTTFLRQEGRPGDLVLCTGLTRPAAEYYLAGRGFTFLSYPRDMAVELAHLDEGWYLRNLDLEREASLVVGEAAAGLAHGNTLWVAASPRQMDDPLFAALEGSALRQAGPARGSPESGLSRLGQPVFLLRYRAGGRRGAAGEALPER
jgi:4-amino-4-deoxy-L-arabinose transferase-like glycosyltransferase